VRRNLAVGVILMLVGISLLLLGANWRTRYGTVSLGVTVLTFVLLVLGLGLVAVELIMHEFWLFFPSEIPDDVHWFGALHMHVYMYGRLVFLETIQAFQCLQKKQT